MILSITSLAFISFSSSTLAQKFSLLRKQKFLKICWCFVLEFAIHFLFRFFFQCCSDVSFCLCFAPILSRGYLKCFSLLWKSFWTTVFRRSKFICSPFSKHFLWLCFPVKTKDSMSLRKPSGLWRLHLCVFWVFVLPWTSVLCFFHVFYWCIVGSFLAKTFDWMFWYRPAGSINIRYRYFVVVFRNNCVGLETGWVHHVLLLTKC